MRQCLLRLWQARPKRLCAADGYKGYGKLYEPLPDGTYRFREAACWAHWRRDFHDIWTSNKSEIAREALDRIGALYDAERDIAGQPVDIRLAVRQKHSKAKVAALRAWAEAQLTRIPGKGDLAQAFRYGLRRWTSFCLFLEDGRVAMDNNASERAASDWNRKKELVICRSGHRRGDLGTCHDDHRNGQDEWRRSTGLSG